MDRRPYAPGDSAGQPRSWRDRAVRRLVSSAYLHVPYYRELYQRYGVDPEKIRGLRDLAALPIADKRGMRVAGASRLIADGRAESSLVAHLTHGSTGEPFIVYRSWREERWLQMFRWRTLLGWGVRPTDRMIKILAASSPATGDSNRLYTALTRMGLVRLKVLDCLLPPEELASELELGRPQIVGGYPSALAAVARALITKGVSLSTPRMVVLGGEVATGPIRRLIARAFAAPIYETYGAHEVNEIAWECPHSGDLHVREETLILEILKDGRPARPGEAGEVVCTALWSYAMPFIRYRLGDVAVIADGPCACGRPGLRLRSVAGRTVDYFELPDGRQVHPYEIFDRALDVDWLIQYQLVQERRDLVVITIVPRRSVGRLERDRMASRLRACLGSEVRCELVFRNEIPSDPGGKCMTYRSMVRR